MSHLSSLRTLAVILAFAAAGCKKGGDDSAGETDVTAGNDADGDGFTDDVDCDDNDATVNPEAAETCDGIDNNCSGTTDEGVGSTFYADTDGDGFGDPDAGSTMCSATAGFVADDTDCDDGDGDVHPGADEFCDGTDHDCDTLVNEDDSDDAGAFYADTDGDGFGDAGDSVIACDAPANYVADDTDCDDTSDQANPDGTETCGDGLDNDCNGTVDVGASNTVTFYADSDNDGYGDVTDSQDACAAPNGYVTDSTDCDDTNSAVNPGEIEVCDSADNDCDGYVDVGANDATTFYADADGDSFGDASDSVDACSQPSGYVTDDTDCDDTEPDAYPGNPEVCDSIDNDCNSSVDDGATDATTYYADVDSDGFGDAATAIDLCTAPTDLVADGTDCDDDEPAAYPGATEVCDGIDNDCDGSADESGAVGETVFYIDADGDGAGDAGTSVTACFAPTGYVADSSDCDDTEVENFPGNAEICDGIDNNCDTQTDEECFRATPTDGSAITITSDAEIAVLANRTAGEIRVVDIDLTASPVNGTEIDTFDMGPDSEPFTSVIANDDDTAYIVLRNTGEVVRIRNLKTTPTLGTTPVATDADPSGIAITPTGSTLYVTNWSAGTITKIDTVSWTATGTIDLNQALIDSGVLGSSVTASRPGLAHPYAITITDDGDIDDSDETVYVTEFFGQDLPSADAGTLGDAYFDEGRQGIVYHFDTATETVDTTTIAPFSNTGFLDSLNQTTGCFPNQLYAATVENGRVYISSMCESPRGPASVVNAAANVKTKVHGAIFVVDTATDTENVSERVLLTKAFEDLYVAKGTLDDSSRRFPLLPNGLAFVTSGPQHIAYLTAYGADAVFRVEFNSDGTLDEVGSSLGLFMDLGGFATPGRLPYGIATDRLGHAYVLNENSRNVSVLGLGTQDVINAFPAASAPSDPAANEGRRFFVTGLGRWSKSGQGWNSCESCHPHGLTDNVTWFFAAGPRQTTSTDGSFDANGDQRVFNWTAILDEVADFDENTKGVSGGVGAMVDQVSSPLSTLDRITFDGTTLTNPHTDVSQAKLLGSTYDLVDNGVSGVDRAGNAGTVKSVKADWDEIYDYMVGIRAPNAPALDAGDVSAGEALFTAHNCNGCHGGDEFTISDRFYTPSAVNNNAGGLLDTTPYLRGTLPAGLNPPADAGAGTAFLRGGNTIQCVLRAVGTFPTTGTVGVTPAGVTVSERKDDMVSTAGGATGFNPPALIGVGAGAPYFHAGNARTLEEVLDPTFDVHYQALDVNFNPTSQEVSEIAAYLLSIDDTTTAPSSTVSGVTTVICPPTL
jgi:hypothetical protein